MHDTTSCELYRKYWLDEYPDLVDVFGEKFMRRHSREWFSDGMTWTWYPYCRYGYICANPCYRWHTHYYRDFGHWHFTYKVPVVQLSLF